MADRVELDVKPRRSALNLAPELLLEIRETLDVAAEPSAGLLRGVGCRHRHRDEAMAVDSPVKEEMDVDVADLAAARVREAAEDLDPLDREGASGILVDGHRPGNESVQQLLCPASPHRLADPRL